MQPDAEHSTPETRFDVEDVFDGDYLYFYGDRLAQIADEQVGLICRLLELESGMDVLDVPCGHGRIANRLAARGCCVTGLDAAARFLDLARRDAAERGVERDGDWLIDHHTYEPLTGRIHTTRIVAREGRGARSFCA